MIQINKSTPVIQEKWINILDWFYDKYTDLIIVPIEWMQRFFRWGWRCRWNYTFDASHSTYMLIYYNLKDMIDYSRKYGNCVWNSNENGKEFRILKIACKLAKRLWKDEYNIHINEHNKKWGKPNMEFGQLKDGTRRCYITRDVVKKNPELADLERKEWRIANKKDYQQKKYEKKYLYKLLEKYGEGFWD